MTKTDFANRESLGRIELLVLDVDGVLTDGRITLSGKGEEVKTFNVRDGAGMKYWKRAGGKLAVISGRGSPAVTRRAEELDVDAVRLNAKDKLPAFEEVLSQLNLTGEQTAFIGDDLTDIPLALRCAFSAAVADAANELKEVVSYVTEAPGGGGCAREVIEMILKATGKWRGILARDFSDLAPGGDGERAK